jgi:hypothetical protein
MLDTTFREQRWRRAGASEAQLEELAAAHAALSPEQQAAEGARVDGVSDLDLAAELTAGDEDPTAGTISDVLDRVDGDPQRAAVALSHESAKARPRAKLLEALSAVIESQPPE